MFLQKIVLLSLLASFILAIQPGTSVICNSTGDCTACGSSNASTWVAGDPQKCKIADCSLMSAPFTNMFDTICQSCLGSSAFAKPDQSGCQLSSPTVGNIVQCQSANSSCTNCGNVPSKAFSWQPSANDAINCVILSCLAAPYSSGVTDNFCKSCGPTTKQYANSANTACVSSSASCSRNSNWSDTDCKICNGTDQNAKQFASRDKTQCITQADGIILTFISLILIVLILL
ncbi:hypothetical protein ABPG74_020164 [Tetrahymena malaccensis]